MCAFFFHELHDILRFNVITLLTCISDPNLKVSLVGDLDKAKTIDLSAPIIIGRQKLLCVSGIAFQGFQALADMAIQYCGAVLVHAWVKVFRIMTEFCNLDFRLGNSTKLCPLAHTFRFLYFQLL